MRHVQALVEMILGMGGVLGVSLNPGPSRPFPASKVWRLRSDAERIMKQIRAAQAALVAHEAYKILRKVDCRRIAADWLLSPVGKSAEALYRAVEAKREQDRRRAARAAERQRAKYQRDFGRFLESVREAGFTTASAGNHTNLVRWCKSGEAEALGWSEKGDRYSSACTFRRADSHHNFAIPRSWGRTVADQGITLRDGMLTLAARDLGVIGGIQCYAATWVVQGRGCALSSESGILAVHGTDSYHLADSRAPGLAAKKLRQKIAIQKELARENLREAIQRGRWDSVAVYRADSIRAGNCPSGTDDWIAGHFPGRKTATVAELRAAGNGSADGDYFRAFVLGACVVAVRRYILRTA